MVCLQDAPICVHAEGRTTAAAILLAELHDRALHVCHVARREEIEIIKDPFYDKGRPGVQLMKFADRIHQMLTDTN